VSAVSVSVLIDGRPETWASTSETARSLDNAQYAAGRGPLLSAVRTGTSVEANLLGQPEGWPEIQESAAKRQIRMLRCLPLVDQEQVLGALNLYASALTPLDPAEDQLATLLAWHAAFAVSQANMGGAFQRIDDELRSALLARERIAEAKGILMARGGLSSDDAFRILRQASQRSNRKLREVAQELIDSHTSGRSTGGQP
jgi:GAF domain-containing protein